MIISCPECNKRFNINQNLIPKDGRLLQCSNCMHKWHFIIKKNDEIIEEPIKSEEVIIENKNQEKKINPSQEFIPINKYFSKVLKYRFDNSELLITKAIIALNNSTNPLAASNLKNHLNGLVILFIIIVLNL